MGKTTSTTEHYLQCPYCQGHEMGHAKRVPRTAGKYRVKIIHNNLLSFTCAKCGGVFKMEVNPKMILWEYMKPKAREEFKKLQYKRYKGGLTKNGKTI